MSDYTSGKREFQADFVGTVGEGLSLTKRPDSISFDYMTAFCQGPVSVGDVSQGVIDFVWRVRTDGLNVWIAKGTQLHTWEAESLLFTTTGEEIQEIDIAFEQAGRPVICAARNTGTGGASEIWLYWFNPSDSDFVFEMFDSGRNPRILMDYPPDTTIADVLMFYMKDGSGLVFRQQRDLYAIVLTTPIVDATNLYLEEVAYLEGWRIAAYFSEYKADKGQYRLRHIESKLYPVPVNDDAFMALFSLTSAELIIIVIDQALDTDMWNIIYSLTSGELKSPVISQDSDPNDDLLFGDYSLQSGTLESPIIVVDLSGFADIIQANYSLTSGTLIVVVVTHSLHDKDIMTAGATIQSGILA